MNPAPLAALDPAALASCAALASDFDDTITTHGVLEPPALAALTALHSAGVPCVLATGRPLGWAEVLARTLPVRGVVAENGGAYAFLEGRALRVGYLDVPAARDEGMRRVHACVGALRERFAGLEPVRDLTLRATDVALDVGEAVSLGAQLVADALAFVQGEGLYAVASTVHLHVSYRPPDKFAGLVALARALGLADDARALRERWVYVGDSPNDAGAFAAVERSVGVRNVLRYAGSLAHAPAFVTERPYGEGFAELVERLLAARGAHTTRSP